MLEEDSINRKILKQRRHKAKGPMENENHVENNKQLFFTHFHKQGHLVDKCWNLYPTSHQRNLKKVEGHFDKNGKEDSIVDVG